MACCEGWGALVLGIPVTYNVQLQRSILSTCAEAWGLSPRRAASSAQRATLLALVQSFSHWDTKTAYQ